MEIRHRELLNTILRALVNLVLVSSLHYLLGEIDDPRLGFPVFQLIHLPNGKPCPLVLVFEQCHIEGVLDLLTQVLHHIAGDKSLLLLAGRQIDEGAYFPTA